MHSTNSRHAHAPETSRLSKPLESVAHFDGSGETPNLNFDFAKTPTGPLKPADVLRLQRTVGNQAVQRLLADRNSSKPALVQREIMSLEEFQRKTYMRVSTRKKIKIVDTALEDFHKKGQLFGKSSQYLSALLLSIEDWLEVKRSEVKNGRRAGVLELKKQVKEEQGKLEQQASSAAPQAKPSSEEGDITAPGKNATFDDFDGKQYRIYGRKPNRIIEEVKKRTIDDKPVYFAMGQVVDFQATMPVVRYYPQPVSLGDWYPQVTHLNGMNTKPQSGLESALALQESVNLNLDQGMKDEGVALRQDAVEVLYTYSAQRGEGMSGFAADVFDCIKGKVGVEDTVTASQTDLMVTAVNTKKRTTVSAHSRGTIKTDNAVREAYSQLVEQYMPAGRKDPETIKNAVAHAQSIEDSGMGFDHETAYAIALEGAARDFADKLARKNMDAFIQLVYAGNAVSYPSSVLPVEMFVGSSDLISMGVGTYTNPGAKLASGNSKTKLHKQSGGHGFTENYASPVGATIAKDILENR
ncbi:MAG: hypothetical protein J0I20_32455 [Chloroflexi bacterium]|nr:hypothetical protein [Chloroflexota bacterium]OJV91983.1 MAG: hypothetical protein BGO39_12810 [Chloroflexi bacterium 54-19]